MLKANPHNHIFKFVGLFFTLIAALWFVVAHGQLSGQAGQEQAGDIVLEKTKDFAPPVEITFIQAKIGVIEPGKKLSANNDWFKGLAITVRNDSEKAITHISLKMRFPRAKEQADELDYVETLNYGETPIPDKDGQTLVNTAKPILPGESVDIRLSDEVYDIVRTMLKESKYPLKIRRIKVYVALLGFSDGTVWMGGKTYRFDRNNPGKLIPLEKKLTFNPP